MNINKLFVLLTAAIFAFYGVGFIVDPIQLALMVTGESPQTATGIADMRATYGGMSLAVGAVLLMLASKPQTIQLGLLAVLMLMLGMAGGRAVGIMMDGDVNSTMYTYLAVEIVTAVIAWVLLLRSR